MNWILVILALAVLIVSIVLLDNFLQQELLCGVEQCHGMELTCGKNVPDACTALYQAGDFCRQYFAGCEAVNGICMKKVNASADSQFSVCKTCISDCTNSPEAIDCDSKCRDLMKKYCYHDSDCACGVSIDTGDCFYGNKAFVNASQQCPDFCTGIGGNLVINCVNNTCEQSQAG